MSVPRRRFTQEFKDELVCEVIETSKSIVDVAKAYGVGAETLRRWVVRYREVHGVAVAELSAPDRVKFKELERENQDLRAEMAFLKKAASYFAREPR